MLTSKSGLEVKRDNHYRDVSTLYLHAHHLEDQAKQAKDAADYAWKRFKETWENHEPPEDEYD